MPVFGRAYTGAIRCSMGRKSGARLRSTCATRTLSPNPDRARNMRAAVSAPIGAPGGAHIQLGLLGGSMPAQPHQGNSRRRFFQNLAAGVGARAAPMILSAAERAPNIIYIHSHDTGRYLQPYGYSVPTPNLLKLAREGVLFRNAFSVAPTCSPSRAALLTGQCAHGAGMLGLVNRGFAMPDYRKHLLYTLRE